MGYQRAKKDKKDTRSKIDFGWESEKDRLRRFMRISPQRKLEWLREMSEFIAKCYSFTQKRIFRKLRALR